MMRTKIFKRSNDISGTDQKRPAGSPYSVAVLGKNLRDEFNHSLRLCVFALNLLLLPLASCAAPAPVSVTPAASPAPTTIAHAPEIRFALVGQPTDVSVWSLFDESGASYANYALHSDEYPRLYRLSIPEREFEAFIADGMPSIVTQEGEFYVATVKLQPGLKWSDGSPLTAQDAAFTVNTALAFHLGYDWLSAYNPELLARAEALDDATLKFFFKRPFNVGDWQYGALQGPIVSQAYWSPKVVEATTLLPSADLTSSLENTKADAATLQARIDADNAQLLTTQLNTPTYTELSARITRNQNEVNSLNFHLVKLQDESDAALNAARAALFAVADDGEPTFGPFLRATQSGDTFTREVNPLYPFEPPNYDRAAYTVFEDVDSAYSAFTQANVEVVLGPYDGIREQLAHVYPTSSTYFLAFNPERAVLAEPNLRKAISCIMGIYVATEWSLESFAVQGPWQKAQSLPGCSNVTNEQDIQATVEILKAAGYSWQQEPTSQEAGRGLTLPNGQPFPPVTLLTILPEYDRLRMNATAPIPIQLQYLGIPLVINATTPDSFRYAVYSSRDYDIAILGYRLSAYPGYLCEWFQAPSPFEYDSDRLKSACETMTTTADLETARQASIEVQSILMEDLPFVPQYQIVRFEIYQNVTYPFEQVLDGISGLYGAPSLAIPAP